MATIKVEISGKGLRLDSVKKLVEESIQKRLGDGVSVSISKHEPPESRADRLSEAGSLVEEAKGEVESLKDELQDWYDNLPENFQNGDKGQQLEEAIGNLEEIISNLENVDFDSVEFPGMY